MSVSLSDNLKHVAGEIQSIGRNCEFGYIQRVTFHIEPISLLRWAGSGRRAGLAEAFRNRFEGLTDAMRGRGDPPGKPPEHQDWWLTDERYDILFHTNFKVAEHTLEQATEKARDRLKRSAEMQVEAVEDADKLFLYSDAALGSIEEARDLFEALRSIGPAWLLVVIADQARAGSAVLVEDGLIGGFVSALTSMGNATAFSFDPWPSMLEQAHRIWRDQRS